MAAVATKSMESLNKLLMDDLPMTKNPLAEGGDNDFRSVAYSGARLPSEYAFRLTYASSAHMPRN